MNKKLKAELVSIAHRILQIKDTTDAETLKEEARKVYELLSVYAFAKANNDNDLLNQLENPTTTTPAPAAEVPVVETVVEQPAPVVEKPVAEVPVPEPVQEIEDALQDLLPKKKYMKNDMEDIAEAYGKMPEFERKETVNNTKRKASINDSVKKGYKVGMNERMGYIKHLFAGDGNDYNRVISQLETLNSLDEAVALINNQIKPDYNNWEGKEEYEERFMALVESNLS